MYVEASDCVPKRQANCNNLSPPSLRRWGSRGLLYIELFTSQFAQLQTDRPVIPTLAEEINREIWSQSQGNFIIQFIGTATMMRTDYGWRVSPRHTVRIFTFLRFCGWFGVCISTCELGTVWNSSLKPATYSIGFWEANTRFWGRGLIISFKGNSPLPHTKL